MYEGLWESISLNTNEINEIVKMMNEVNTGECERITTQPSADKVITVVKDQHNLEVKIIIWGRRV